MAGLVGAGAMVVEENEEVQVQALYLKRDEDARLRAGHVWVFANEVDTKRSPLTSFAPGEACAIMDARGHALGVGYVNPHSLICARLVSRGLQHALDASLLVHRIKVALGLRERMYEKPFYRLLYGEADGVPGLTVDRFDDVLVAQATTAGIDRLKPAVEQALAKVLKPRALVWKNDAGVRELEGLPSHVEIGFGDLSEPVLVDEAGLRFEIDPIGGQKTGWFYDQRSNRDLVAPWLAGKRVLDLFSYVGGWSLRAAAAGASDVLAVDASASAVAAVQKHAQDNGFGDRIKAQRADAFEYLRDARERRERFDAVIVDPPAFVKRKKDLSEGRQAYRRINELAMRVLSRDGLLVSCSCSHHFSEQALLGELQKAARHIDRSVQVLARLQQGPDHPLHPAIAETGYLRGFVCRVLPA